MEAYAGVERAAQEALLRLRGKALRNEATGMEAYINSKQAGKLVSDSAVRKSEANGFTREQHNALVAQIEGLWRHAVQASEQVDKRGGDGNTKIRRFVVPVRMGEELSYAAILAKESVRNGQRIYTLEAHAEAQKMLQGINASADGSRGAVAPHEAARSIAERLSELERLVKGEGEPSNALEAAARSEEPVGVSVRQGGKSLGATYQLGWHGSPYKGIEKEGFKLWNIGTGEGAQAYGWGVYFAENKAVAESYREKLVKGKPDYFDRVRYKGRELTKEYLRELSINGSSAEQWMANSSRGRSDYLESAGKGTFFDVLSVNLQALEERLDKHRKGLPDLREKAEQNPIYVRHLSWAEGFLEDGERILSFIKELWPHLDNQGEASKGQLYQVDIPESHELLDWEASLDEQPEGVKQVLDKFLETTAGELWEIIEQNTYFDEEWFEGLGLDMDEPLFDTHFAGSWRESGEMFYEALVSEFGGEEDSGAEVASKVLGAFGIPGLRYLDGTSRKKGVGRHNFVIWDESRLTPEAAKIGTTYQLRGVERAVGGRGTYEAQKSRGATKLSYNEWLQVRTPEFKGWFGDWEGLRAQRELDAMEPVKVAVPEQWRGLSLAQLRKEALAKLKGLVGDKRKGEGFTDIEHPELGRIRVDSRGVKKTRSSSADPAKLIVAAHVDTILPQAIYSRSELPEEGSNKPNLEGASKLLARVNVDGEDLVTIFTVLREPDGQWYYNTVTVSDSNSPRGEAGGSNMEYSQPKAEQPTTAFTGLAEHVREPLRRVKRESVSPVVDPKTREPLVVYHGTGDEFTVFKTRSNPNYTFSGIFFSERQETAEGYAFGADRATMPVWLRMQKPLYVKAVGSKWSALSPDISISGHREYYTLGEAFKLEQDAEGGYDPFAKFSTDEVARWAQGEGFDGVIFEELSDGVGTGDDGSPTDVYVVFESRQVKSATGNRGTFDGTNPDITYQLQEPRQLAKRQAFEATGVPQSILDEIEARLSRVRARKVQEREAALRLSPAAQAAGAAADEVGLATRVARGALDKWAEPVRRRLEGDFCGCGGGIGRLAEASQSPVAAG